MYALHVFSNVYKSNHTYNIDFVHCVKLLLAIYSVEILLVSITSVNDVGKRFISVAWHHTKQWRVIQNLLNQSFIPFNSNHFPNQSTALLEAMDFKCMSDVNLNWIFSSRHRIWNDEWLFMCSCYLLYFRSFYVNFSFSSCEESFC